MYTEAEEALDALADGIPSSNGWTRANCPFCPGIIGKVDKRRSFGCSADGFYHCFRCGTAGKLSADDWTPFEGTETKSNEENDQFEPPVDYVPLWCEPGRSAYSLKEPRDYLINERGLDYKIMADAKIGACLSGEYGGRIIVPILALDGWTWLGYAARDWTQRQFLRYRYPVGMPRSTIMYHQEVLLVETDEPAIVVEGVFDALPYFSQACALLGKPSPWQIEQLKTSRRPLAIVLDGDAWEEGWTLSKKLMLAGVRVGNVKLPAGEDPNSVDLNWLRKAAAQCVA